ncbi:AAA family ATPase [Pseudonocardia nigra]|uniref:AAA family ATPase n=1 Tax=Pseudonocardia nigra TaxID=1921578 RepID=UPI001C5CF91F|nr:AAA family ATPase [Pseudonocardia nigra]
MVGREQDAAVLRAALRAGRHVLLEGPAGAGKTLLLRHVCRDRRVVEVNATTVFSAGGLVGRTDPGRALVSATSAHRPARAGARPFLPGALVEAMRAGAVLVLDEANRLAPDAFAVLVPAMSEGELTVPGLGQVAAAAGFRVVAVANPQDRIGTGAIPAAFLDGRCGS